MLAPEFNNRKEVIQCRVGPWRWWWSADAEPAVSQQFRAGWLHPATRKLRKLDNGAASFPVGTRPGATSPTRPTISKLTEGRGNAAFFVIGGACAQICAGGQGIEFNRESEILRKNLPVGRGSPRHPARPETWRGKPRSSLCPQAGSSRPTVGGGWLKTLGS